MTIRTPTLVAMGGPADDRSPRRGELSALLIACTATTLVMGLVAAMNLTIPSLAASSLHPDAAQLLWIIDAYVVIFACLVIPGGAAGDRFGRKGVLIAGLLLFGAGAALSALAPSIPVLLAARIVSGVGAALVLPNCVGIVIHATALERRPRALAVWGTISGLGGLFGNLGGGALLTTGHWQLLFWTVAPLAVACAIWAAVGVHLSARRRRPLDPAGTLLLVAATVTLLAGIIEGPAQGWTSPLVLGAFVLSTLLWAAWITTGLRAANPLLDPRLFRNSRFAAAAAGMTVLFFGSFGLFFINASVLQYGRGFTPLQTGLAILPMVAPMLAGARLVPRLVARVGLTLTLTIAFVFIGVGLLGLAGTITAPYPIYALWLFVVGCGFVLGMPTLTVQLATALPPTQAGLGGGLQAATRELGSALGVAVAGTILTAVFSATAPIAAHGAHTITAALTANPDEAVVITDAYLGGAATALDVAGITTILLGSIVALTLRIATRRGNG